MENFIWILTNKMKVEWDSVSGVIVSARNAKQAREIAAKNARDEGPDTWKNPCKSSCKSIGISHRSNQKLILQDILEG
ncbi:MAG: hypothetical protein WCO84_00260 [bacterium]